MKQPHLRCNKRDVNKFCLLPGDPGRVLRIIKHLKNPRKVSENRGYLIYNGDFKGVPVTVCSTGMGGPSIAIAIHELHNCGAKVMIRVGSCGALQKGMKIGDLVISEGAVRGESTTNLYYPAEHPALPSSKVFNALKKSAKGEFYTGFTYSHDGFYHKGSQSMDDFWSRVGLLAADFETAPLFIISEYLNVKAGSILNVVSPYGGFDFENVEAYASGEAASMKGEEKSIMVALSAIKKLSEE
jgi:uridine phosphorylase